MVLKGSSYLFILFLTAFLVSCKNKTTQFFIDYRQEVSLPENVVNWVLISDAIQTDCQVLFEKNDTKRSKVHQIFLKNITIISDQKEVLSNLNLKAINMECPSISREKIAFKRINKVLTDSSVQFQLLESVQDVKEFIKHNQFAIELFFQGKKRKEPVQATLILEFLVEGELIKTILHQRMLV